MEVILALVICAVLAAFVIAPLRGRGGDGAEAPGQSADLADLEARKEAIYRQIRDAELDREEGKLTVADWRLVDAELRREAIELLREIDALEAARSDG
jgi:hypothetical protein